MAIDYTDFINGDIKWAQLAERYTFDEILEETRRLYDAVRDLLQDIPDAAVAYIPQDPDAHDKAAATEDEEHVGWSIGHVVAHLTASNEETFLFASLLARGIQHDGRLRTEAPWEDIDTAEKALQRLEESRRIVFAYASALPDEPRMDVLRAFGSEKAAAYFGDINAKASMLMGLTHHREHVQQIAKVKQQAEETLIAM
ncbi:MAG: DinB family protein [Chloroflexota bacterium]